MLNRRDMLQLIGASPLASLLNVTNDVQQGAKEPKSKNLYNLVNLSREYEKIFHAHLRYRPEYTWRPIKSALHVSFVLRDGDCGGLFDVIVSEFLVPAAIAQAHHVNSFGRPLTIRRLKPYNQEHMFGIHCHCSEGGLRTTMAYDSIKQGVRVAFDIFCDD